MSERAINNSYQIKEDFNSRYHIYRMGTRNAVRFSTTPAEKRPGKVKVFTQEEITLYLLQKHQFESLE